jgi:hypothetical protein
MAVDTGKLEGVPGPVHRRPGDDRCRGQCGDRAPARLYQALAAGPVTAGELAARTGTSPGYIAGWRCGQRRQVRRI